MWQKKTQVVIDIFSSPTPPFPPFLNFGKICRIEEKKKSTCIYGNVLKYNSVRLAVDSELKTPRKCVSSSSRLFVLARVIWHQNWTMKTRENHSYKKCEKRVIVQESPHLDILWYNRYLTWRTFFFLRAPSASPKILWYHGLVGWLCGWLVSFRNTCRCYITPPGNSMIVPALTPFSTLFQLYCGSQCAYTCFCQYFALCSS